MSLWNNGISVPEYVYQEGINVIKIWGMPLIRFSEGHFKSFSRGIKWEHLPEMGFSYRYLTQPCEKKTVFSVN